MEENSIGQKSNIGGTNQDSNAEQLAERLGLSKTDISQIVDHNLSLEVVESQLSIFRRGIPKTILVRPAIVGDGIIKLSDTEFSEYARKYDNCKNDLKIARFIPASGAASRMFKFLSEFLNDFDVENETINAYINRKKDSELTTFLAGLEKFPFYKAIRDKLHELHPDLMTWDKGRRLYQFIVIMLQSKDFDFANKPKGVLPFHKYKGKIATPVEEHMCQSASFAGSDIDVHFTVSEEHRHLFEDIIAKTKQPIEESAGISIHTSFSYQDTATDTIAVSPDNQPFRDKNCQLVFRPGGHGALIQNLGQQDADLIFIQNIDNVIQQNLHDIAIYKKALAGVLLSLQEEVFRFLALLNNDGPESIIDEAATFATQKLNVEIDDDIQKYTTTHKIEYLQKILNRPIRVCGMVKNEGDTGGGPFWISDKKGRTSLQIVETSQVDTKDESQAKILATATHFNPVDIVCGTKNFHKRLFDLKSYVDPDTGFIVDKNKDGKPLKGYELPGLWNGAMAKWITIFVEVPLITFNPVKTVNDLLKPAHQRK